MGELGTKKDAESLWRLPLVGSLRERRYISYMFYISCSTRATYWPFGATRLISSFPIGAETPFSPSTAPKDRVFQLLHPDTRGQQVFHRSRIHPGFLISELLADKSLLNRAQASGRVQPSLFVWKQNNIKRQLCLLNMETGTKQLTT